MGINSGFKGLTWLRIEQMVSAGQNGNKPSGSTKWVGIYKLSEELSASQERLYYVEFFFFGAATQRGSWPPHS